MAIQHPSIFTTGASSYQLAHVVSIAVASQPADPTADKVSVVFTGGDPVCPALFDRAEFEAAYTAYLASLV